jgi:hypothetical protein
MIGLTRRHGIKNGKEQIKINNMNMILDTTLTGPEAILIIICGSFILGMFWHAGNKMSEYDFDNADFFDDSELSEDDFIDDEDEGFKGIL